MSNISGAYVRRQEMFATEDELAIYGSKVLLENEVIYIRMNDGEIRQKIGDGTTSVANLPFAWINAGMEHLGTIVTDYDMRWEESSEGYHLLQIPLDVFESLYNAKLVRTFVNPWFNSYYEYPIYKTTTIDLVGVDDMGLPYGDVEDGLYLAIYRYTPETPCYLLATESYYNKYILPGVNNVGLSAQFDFYG